MKLVVWKNNLGGQIWYRSLDHVKKTASIIFHQTGGLNLPLLQMKFDTLLDTKLRNLVSS